jgi:hypothetical protein
MDAISWAWMPDGLLALKKFGFASFCKPAKQKVKPRNARRGRRAHPEVAKGLGGGARKSVRRRRRPPAVPPRRAATRVLF